MNSNQKTTLSLDLATAHLDARRSYCNLFRDVIAHFTRDGSKNLEASSITLDLTQDGPSTVHVVSNGWDHQTETIAMFHLYSTEPESH